MKALTLTQPWATLVAIGAKRIETRGWKTSYRGRLAIHAAKRFPVDDRALVYEPPFRDALVPYLNMRLYQVAALHPLEKYLHLGAVIATCSLANVLPVEVVDNASNVFGVSLEPLSEQERAFGNYSPGRFAWILEDIKMLPEPVYTKGALSLWEWVPPRTPERPDAFSIKINKKENR